MTLSAVIAALEAAGTAQNRKVYARHGYPETTFGVSFANLDKLKKKIKNDHQLAVSLWATGNADARMLAVMITDPAAITEDELEAWAADITFYVLADVFAARLVSKSPFARKKAWGWTKSHNEYLGQIGWDLVAHLAMNDTGIPDSAFEKDLPVIERKIHKARNRTRHAMNGALIAIGGRNEALREKALAAATRIGTVEVDHGNTGCKTPNAADYIDKIWRRRQ